MHIIFYPCWSLCEDGRAAAVDNDRDYSVRFKVFRVK